MTKVEKMLNNNIPVIESLCDEPNGKYAFYELTEQQQLLVNKILSGFPISFNVSERVIMADGEDEIILTASGEPNTTVTINIMTGTSPSAIDILLDAEGNGSQTFSCNTPPTIITFSHGDVSTKVRAL